MRDRVNRPFAQFETVPLNDGVDFSEIDGKDADDMADEERQKADEIGINETGAEEVQKQHSQEDETRIPGESVVLVRKRMFLNFRLKRNRLIVRWRIQTVLMKMMRQTMWCLLWLRTHTSACGRLG